MNRIGTLAIAARLLGLAAFLAPALPAAAEPAGEVRAAETLVRQVYFEDIPIEQVRALTPIGEARLLEMLRDPAERAHGPNIAVALGIAAPHGSFEALAAAAEPAGSGEIDRATYRMIRAIPFAMGHLARQDERALAWLIERARVRGRIPGWSHGSRRGPDLADQLRRNAIAGLGLSGRVEAERVLDEIAADPSRRAHATDPELAAQLATARDVCARIATAGADAALGARRAQ